MIQKKYYKLVKVSYADSDVFRITNISNQTGIFSVYRKGTLNGYTLEYSTDGVNWNTYDLTNLPTIEVTSGNNLYLRGDSTYGLGSTSSNYTSFSMDVDHTIGGNFCSLIYKTNYSSMTSINWDSYTQQNFAYLFKNDTHLISAEDMNFGNVTTLTKSSGNNYTYFLYGAFSGCTGLTKTPDFSSITTLNSVIAFLECFSGCTNLTSADFSSITTISGYGSTDKLFGSCFRNCSKLSTVLTPNISSWNTTRFENWLQSAGTSVTGTKTVYKPAALSIPTSSASGVPNGWTTQNY